jgi:hypothetical protein
VIMEGIATETVGEVRPRSRLVGRLLLSSKSSQRNR